MHGIMAMSVSLNGEKEIGGLLSTWTLCLPVCVCVCVCVCVRVQARQCCGEFVSVYGSEAGLTAAKQILEPS